MESPMKRLCIVLALLLCGCASLEKNLVKDVMNDSRRPLDRCEVEGFAYPGTDSYLGGGRVLKVLMIHGVGLHHPGYSRRLQENLAANIGLDVISRLPKNIRLLSPADGKTPIGNLRITYWQNRVGDKKLLFYELTWSEITTPDKKIIAFDTTEQYSKFRVPFNNTMKSFLDNTLPDPLIYEVDKNNLILDSAGQSICWMLKTGWNDIPAQSSKVCRMSLREGLERYNRENVMFITHSLGSKILMDSISLDADNVSEAVAASSADTALKEEIRKLQNKEITVFMLANQLPILQIGHPLPKVHNRLNAYCSRHGEKYGQRLFKAVNIVAFSDPNDILSYAVPQEFVDKYIDSRICPRVTNVSVNVAPEISAFGIGFVNPVTAHTAYDNSPKVINLITEGTAGFDRNRELSAQCRFIEMKSDRNMK